MTTVGLSLDTFCRGLLAELSEEGYDVVALSSPDQHLTSLCSHEGVRGIGVKMTRNISPLADLRSLWTLVKVMRREKPAMVHTMTPKAGLLGMLAARMAGVPVRVHTFTGLLFPTARGLRRRLLLTTDRITCAAATHIIPEGEGVRADLIAARVTRKPLRVLGHGNVKGVDLAHFTPTPQLREEAAALRQRFGIAPGEKTLIFVGRLVRDKGLRELAQAVKGLDCHLILVGAPEGGPDDIDTAIFGGNPRVHWSGGWIADIRPWILAADALVFPSYREGFPNVVLEAGALGLPSIVTDINGSREIITDGINGFVVPPQQSAPLAAAIARLLAMPAEQLQLMGSNARADIEARFSQPFVRRCLKEFYKEILTSTDAS